MSFHVWANSAGTDCERVGISPTLQGLFKKGVNANDAGTQTKGDAFTADKVWPQG